MSEPGFYIFPGDDPRHPDQDLYDPATSARLGDMEVGGLWMRGHDGLVYPAAPLIDGQRRQGSNQWSAAGAAIAKTAAREKEAACVLLLLL